ncbi:DExH-box ATP-dependent RNA helicase DExH18, mitochondrial-like [Hibiscus syriacus]|uniref:DExH-box ATP-dependent RNA helicase DExH18, mitochondrial-like n=1 Tax=Hibiscus syriacus TaxID=106335 RepID=UPI001924DE15|nr:DExH-box ATP-dependent RNA helicase DExH18, mitochondrial-like [Hibiscus syriacus]
MIQSADLIAPHTWFPLLGHEAKIIYHRGPTNSGKTYNALQRYMEAKKGIYCSPLRLLAMEVFDKVNAQGVYCSLLTGQEKKFVPFSNHVACTVEMMSTEDYDVAVIDEIQMMSDPYRCYAWTSSLLGLISDEIHLCGDPTVLNIVRKICSETGDELHEHHYDRFKPLVVEAKTLLGDLKNVRSGDCVVAFSRREIFEVKMAIEKHTSHRCCVIYGALPPKTRSDSVGMGLNLNIRRVVFYSLSKYNGYKIVAVPASQVKQIAGRAGRRGSRYPDGLTTTLHLEDLDYLINCLVKIAVWMARTFCADMIILRRSRICWKRSRDYRWKTGSTFVLLRSILETRKQCTISLGLLQLTIRMSRLALRWDCLKGGNLSLLEEIAVSVAELLGNSLVNACWKPESRLRET